MGVLNKSFAQDTDMSTAQGLPSLPAAANAVLMQAEGNNIRFMVDGTTATTATGFRLLTAADPIYYEGDLSLVSIIEEGTSAKINCTYYS